jgi:hypothetical protein
MNPNSWVGLVFISTFHVQISHRTSRLCLELTVPSYLYCRMICPQLFRDLLLDGQRLDKAMFIRQLVRLD